MFDVSAPIMLLSGPIIVFESVVTVMPFVVSDVILPSELLLQAAMEPARAKMATILFILRVVW